MSYDLSFHSQGKPIPIAEIWDYFAGRPLYEVGDDTAFYGNEDTEVFFRFVALSGDDPDALPIHFNCPYGRSHVFGLEAEPELTEFVRHFDLTVDDPQAGGRASYSREVFLRSWDVGNKVACKAIHGWNEESTEEPSESMTLPREKLEAFWNWNYHRVGLMERLEDEPLPVFVPKIVFFAHPDRPYEPAAAVVWVHSDPVAPIAIPAGIEHVLLAAEGIDTRQLAFDQVEPLLARFPRVPENTRGYWARSQDQTIKLPYVNVNYNESDELCRTLFELPGSDYGESLWSRVSASEILSA
jgi:hypothetical protein